MLKGRIVAVAIAVMAVACMAAPASAQYPNRPIRLVVSFPPGGSADAAARAVQAAAEKHLGQPLVIENRGGAGGNIGIDAVAKAEPDGYTIGLGAAGALAINVSINDKMPYDPIKDLAPITLVGTSPFILAAANSAPIKTLREALEAAKAKPGELSIGHGGNGTAMHLTAALLNQLGNVKMTFVPYRGTGPVVADLVAGHVPLGIVDAPSAIGQIKGGQIKALGVTSLKRDSSLPDVPTFDEQGLKGYESVGWYGIVAPAKTPAAVIEKLNAAFVAALKDPEVQARIRAVGAEPAPMSAAQFGAFIRDETVKWSKVVAAAGIKGTK